MASGTWGRILGKGSVPYRVPGIPGRASQLPWKESMTRCWLTPKTEEAWKLWTRESVYTATYLAQWKPHVHIVSDDSLRAANWSYMCPLSSLPIHP